MRRIQHTYPFDPTYGYSEETLLQIQPPPRPEGFESFWNERYKKALAVDPEPTIFRGTSSQSGAVVHDIKFRSTDNFPIGGWLLLPRNGGVERGLVVGHGYDGRFGPEVNLPVQNTAILFPCFRGLSRSARPPISQESRWHVLHNIHDRDQYILGGCVEDVWTSVSTLLTLYPWLEGRIGFKGVSFSAGIGALALPWDRRITKAYLSLPTFGHHPLRLTMHSNGSLAAVREYHSRHPEVVHTLQYFDAAIAARFIKQPVFFAGATFDPTVPPPGQFAIYNAIPAEKELFVLDAGHFGYEGQALQENQLNKRLQDFFANL